MPLPRFSKPSAGRSRNMRAIRSFGNKTTEKRLASLLTKHGVRGWRPHLRGIVGNPDFVIKEKRIAIFVDGCFWHGCPHCGRIPRTNKAYWVAKIARNKRRDRTISRTLRALGYRVIRLWECRLRSNPKHCVALVRRVISK